MTVLHVPAATGTSLWAVRPSYLGRAGPEGSASLHDRRVTSHFPASKVTSGQQCCTENSPVAFQVQYESFSATLSPFKAE